MHILGYERGAVLSPLCTSGRERSSLITVVHTMVAPRGIPRYVTLFHTQRYTQGGTYTSFSHPEVYLGWYMYPSHTQRYTQGGIYRSPHPEVHPGWYIPLFQHPEVYPGGIYRSFNTLRYDHCYTPFVGRKRPSLRLVVPLYHPFHCWPCPQSLTDVHIYQLLGEKGASFPPLLPVSLLG